MSRSILSIRQWLFLAACLLYAVTMTGCSAYQTSHVVEPAPAISPNAVVSAEDAFVPQPFSLVAADSIGLATFGFEIAQWADGLPAEPLVQHN